MKTTFVTLPAYGHLYPMMPLAEAMARHGADVSIAVGAPMHGSLPVRTIAGGPLDGNQMPRAAGLAQKTFPTARDDMRHRWVPSYFGVANAALQLPALRESLAAERPDLVVWEVMAPAGAVVAEELGIPHTCFGLGMVYDWARSLVPMARLTARGAFAGPSPELVPWEVAADPTALRYVDPMPPVLQDSSVEGLVRTAIRPDGWSDPSSMAAMPTFDADHRRPRVYVTLGTVSFRAVDVIRQAVEALRPLEVEVVVAVGPEGDPSLLGDLPQHVRAERFVPQAELLRAVDLVVHHGGSGTTLSAAGAGVPQLVLPQGADQFSNAAAIARYGAGRRLSGEDQTAERIRADVQAMLGDCPERAAAARLAAEIAAMPSPDEVAAGLLDG